tara:strand:- start:274 stop:432 length:159 start_codon:yes stop_codon:yes gene_type:complete
MNEKLEDIAVKATRLEPKDSDSKKNPKETGGPKGLEPTRYGDWERKGRCIDF